MAACVVTGINAVLTPWRTTTVDDRTESHFDDLFPVEGVCHRPPDVGGDLEPPARGDLVEPEPLGVVTGPVHECQITHEAVRGARERRGMGPGTPWSAPEHPSAAVAGLGGVDHGRPSIHQHVADAGSRTVGCVQGSAI